MQSANLLTKKKTTQMSSDYKFCPGQEYFRDSNCSQYDAPSGWEI